MNKKTISFNVLKKIALILLLIAFFSTNLSHVFSFSESIDTVLPKEESWSSKMVYALLELKSIPCVLYSSSESFSVHDSQISLYQEKLLRDHVDVLNQIEQTGATFLHIDSLFHSFNGVIIITRSYHLPLIEKIKGVKRVYTLEDSFELDRLRARLTVRALEITQKDPFPWTGKGTSIGIIDTGVDYLHQDFYPQGIRTDSSKTVDGDDFADKIYEEDRLVKDDQDPMDDALQHRGHGTHVAGIATSNNPDLFFAHGVAPGADLYAYKVFSSKAGASGAQGAHIIQAVERSIKDQCTVINLSLGHRGRPLGEYEDSPYYEVFQNAVKAGVTVVATAGNNGSRFLEEEFNNEWPMSAPGTFENVIQVAATDDRHFFPFIIELNDGRATSINAQRAHFTPHLPQHYSLLDIVDAGFGKESDFHGLELEGKIALISRGPLGEAITFIEKNMNAKEAGALACIIYNYDEMPLIAMMVVDGNLPNPWDLELLPTISMSSGGATWMKELISKGGSFRYASENPVSIADYTSAGPPPDGFMNHFKPDLSAPGTSIYSSLPSVMGTGENPVIWGNRQGTSMAAPVVTGSISLLKEARPELNPYQIRSLLMNTSDILINPVNQEIFSFQYQGAGQINVTAALSSPVIAHPPAIVKSSSDFNLPFELSVDNLSENQVYIDLRSILYGNPMNQENIFTSMDRPFIELLPYESQIVRIWFHCEKEFDFPKKVEGVIWLDVYHPVQDRILVQNLHVPFILFNEDLYMQIENPISEVTLSSDALSMTTDEPINISFQLNSGSQYRTIDKEGKMSISVRNYASRLSVDIVNLAGDHAGNIFYAENLPVGRYQFNWNGKNSKDHLFLEDGSYRIIFSLHLQLNDQKNDERHVLLFPMAKQTINITDSPLSIHKDILVSYPRIMQNNQRYFLKLHIKEVDNTVYANSIITFPSSWTNLHIFPSSHNLNTNYQWEENDRGEQTLIMESFRKTFLDSGNEWIVGIISFTLSDAIENETPIVKTELSDFHGIQRKTKHHTPNWVFPANKLGVLDFNNDNIIDHDDLMLFFDHFGSEFVDKNWNPSFDLNSNWKVSIEDLLILSAYFK